MFKAQKLPLQETLIPHPSQKGFETPGLENIAFPIISTIKFTHIFSEEKGRSKKGEFFLSQPTNLIQVSVARRYFSIRKCFHEINDKNDWGLFCLHPSSLFLVTVKIKTIIKTRYSDILEIQAPGKFQIC